MKLIKGSLIILNIMLFTGLFLGFLHQFFDPGHGAILTTSSLLYPYFVVAVFIVFILLVVLRSPWAWVSLIALVFTSGNTLRQIGFHFQRGLPTDSLIYSITTLNTKDDFTHNETDQKQAFLTDFADKKPTIMAMQEVSEGSIDGLRRKMNYAHSSFQKGLFPATGLAIFSDFPIKKVETLNSSNGHLIALICDITLPVNTIRIANIHLHTNAVTIRAGQFSPESISRQDGLRALRDMIRSYGETARLRMDELHMVRSAIDSSPHPVMIAGDANDTPFSPVYRKLKGELQDTFVKGGLGFAQTYNGLFLPLKIDHIFADSNFHIFKTKIKKIDYSDHNPITTTFSLIQ